MWTLRLCLKVSIHAPVKGRRGFTQYKLRRKIVSIHAPVKGRQHPVAIREMPHRVSIHAPVKGRPCRMESLPKE